MKRFFLPILLTLTALAQAQEAARQVGDVDRYAVQLTVSTSFGEVVQKLKMTKTVLKVYDDGSADLQTTFDGAVVGSFGQEAPMAANATKPTTERVDRLGRAIQGAMKGGLSLDPTDFALLGIPDMADAVVGKEFPLDDETTQGKATILSLDEKTIKIGTDFILREAGAASAMRLKVTTTFDLRTNRIVASEGEIAGGLPDEGEVKIEGVKFTLTHLH